ncbi:CSRP2 [Branchiostoma lanceolatum]|uniref:CSRP2 protein n=1 Tax=Branchiostoma lanceolatum TaxID=7740 RepID=A0A8J9W0G7_BRALA|nr:CSRP2 [Branchiostoma lanceolatum]
MTSSFSCFPAQRFPTMPRFMDSTKCPKCDRTVYQNEEVLLGGKSFHKRSCFVCSVCNKMLDSTTVKENEGVLFCKSCYGETFGPKGYGYGQGGGALGMTGKR